MFTLARSVETVWYKIYDQFYRGQELRCAGKEDSHQRQLRLPVSTLVMQAKADI